MRPRASQGGRSSRTRPVIAISMGDPSGIGPEVILRALRSPRMRREAAFIIVGAGTILDAVATRFRLPRGYVKPYSADERLAPGEARLIELAPLPAALAARGQPTAAGGLAALEYIRFAARLTLDGAADALVTAPINKHALAMAGSKAPGHTELLGKLAGAKPIMMLVGGGLRVALTTIHCPVARLPRLITRSRTLETIRITASDLRLRFGVAKPRIGVCGLNPHAGEHGRFGREEARAIAPAIRAAAANGIDCRGPIPADVVFHQMLGGRFDAVVAMYHDQGAIPVKTLAFDRGVNATLGLPIIRTSPDHGTAYDIAPRGVADAGSMIAAIEMAREMALRRARRKRGEAGRA